MVNEPKVMPGSTAEPGASESTTGGRAVESVTVESGVTVESDVTVESLGGLTRVSVGVLTVSIGAAAVVSAGNCDSVESTVSSPPQAAPINRPRTRLPRETRRTCLSSDQVYLPVM